MRAQTDNTDLGAARAARPGDTPGPDGRPARLADAIRAQARVLKFDACGIVRADANPADSAALQAWLADGRHGDMDWMARTALRRGAPTALWPEARSIVAVGLNYASGRDPLALRDAPERGAISVYAQGRDYHDVLKARLKALARWIAETLGGEVKVFTDTAPVMEKPLAQRAGLGWAGKHTNLVSRSFGSWLFLGEVFTTLDLEPDTPQADACGSCSRCLDACPTGALPAPYRIEPRRCISYLTIEHKGPIPAELRPLMGNRIYGCDDCLAVCPWNKYAVPTGESAFLPRVELTAPRLADLAQLDDQAFRTVFAGSPIKRTGRGRFVRNVLIALGNSGDARFAAVAEARLRDDDPLVRGAAVWAFSRLASSARFKAVADACQPNESDPAVLAEWTREAEPEAAA
jgi:epoxyqueuosine reductase